VNKAGKATHIYFPDIHTKVLDYWKSPKTGVVYPIHWQVIIPSQRLKLDVNAPLADQELDTAKSTRVTYWEGTVDVTGTKAGKEITGEGYLELTGYDKTFQLPKP
jgi:predicted secreted hydrolase